MSPFSRGKFRRILVFRAEAWGYFQLILGHAQERIYSAHKWKRTSDHSPSYWRLLAPYTAFAVWTISITLNDGRCGESTARDLFDRCDGRLLILSFLSTPTVSTKSATTPMPFSPGDGILQRRAVTILNDDPEEPIVPYHVLTDCTTTRDGKLIDADIVVGYAVV